MQSEIWIWALAPGETEKWKEQMISCQCKNAEDVEKVKTAAGDAGWHSFRVTKWDGSAPNFAQSVAK